MRCQRQTVREPPWTFLASREGGLPSYSSSLSRLSRSFINCLWLSSPLQLRMRRSSTFLQHKSSCESAHRSGRLQRLGARATSSACDRPQRPQVFVTSYTRHPACSSRIKQFHAPILRPASPFQLKAAAMSKAEAYSRLYHKAAIPVHIEQSNNDDAKNNISRHQYANFEHYTRGGYRSRNAAGPDEHTRKTRQELCCASDSGTCYS